MGSLSEKGLPELSFIGLGHMGGAQARCLIRAGYTVNCYDKLPDRVQACVDVGGRGALSVRDAVGAGEYVLTSLPSSAVWTRVAESELVPYAQESQVFMDMGTTELEPTLRFAAAFAKRGAYLLDTPVSGGERGSQTGTLRIFIGGDEEAASRSRPILDVLGDEQHVVYCGPSGSGQIVKAVNQLMMGLVDAAVMESLAIGARAGIDLAAMRKAVGGTGGSRGYFSQIASLIEGGRGEDLTVKFPELGYFLGAAETLGFDLPLTRALFDFLDDGPRHWVDNMNRPDVSFWHEVLTRLPSEARPE